MNKTNIEWTDYTWNPVTGCLHSCRNTYCYNTMKSGLPLARFGAKYKNSGGNFVFEKKWRTRETGQIHIAEKGEVYPYGYDPTFYGHRLNQPKLKKKPGRIFVVDTGDLFGKWVPSLWIDALLKVVNETPQHTFQFLTKNPEKMLEYKFPKNSWVGTSVNSNDDFNKAELVKKVDAPIRYLSIEPLLGEIDLKFEGFQWIIIGAQTGKNSFVPKEIWIKDILIQARDFNIPVFLKNNIYPFYQCRIQNFPK